MKNYEITRQYNMYKNDSKQYKKLYDLLSIYIYTYPAKVSYRYKELGGDFWLLMQNKIENIIKNFVYRGIPFEVYIATILRYQFITFIKKFINDNKRIHMYNNQSALFSITQEKQYVQGEVKECQGMYWTSKNKEIREDNTVSQFVSFFKNQILSNATKKRIWWFVLKYSPLLSQDMITEFSKEAGVSSIHTKTIFRLLKSDIEGKREKRRKMLMVCNMYFSMYSRIERILKDDTCTKEEISELREKRIHLKNKYRKKKKSLESMNFTVSNARISEVLGIPKGTIDSGIALFRKMCMKIRKIKQF